MRGESAIDEAALGKPRFTICRAVVSVVRDIRHRVVRPEGIEVPIRNQAGLGEDGESGRRGLVTCRGVAAGIDSNNLIIVSRLRSQPSVDELCNIRAYGPNLTERTVSRDGAANIKARFIVGVIRPRQHRCAPSTPPSLNIT